MEGRRKDANEPSLVNDRGVREDLLTCERDEILARALGWKKKIFTVKSRHGTGGLRLRRTRLDLRERKERTGRFQSADLLSALLDSLERTSTRHILEIERAKCQLLGVVKQKCED